jgi:hypothetical protein
VPSALTTTDPLAEERGVLGRTAGHRRRCGRVNQLVGNRHIEVVEQGGQALVLLYAECSYLRIGEAVECRAGVIDDHVH